MRRRGLLWSLTVRYTLVTTSVAALVLLLLFAALGFVLFRSDALPRALAESLVLKAEEVRLAVVSQDQAAVDRWLDGLRRRGSWRVISDSAFQYSVSFDAQGDTVMRVFSARGDELGSTAPVNGSTEGERQLLGRALAGETDPGALYRREGELVIAATPILDDAGAPAGAVLVRTRVLAGEAEQFWLLAVVGGAFTPVLCLVAPVAVVIGLAFGYLTARGLTRRLGSLAAASAAWSRGDFTTRVTDKARDEVGELAERLNAMAADLQVLVRTRQELASAEERNRLALELHDNVKQQAFAASAQLAAARALLKTDVTAVEARLTDAEALMDGLREELTQLIHELRPPSLGDHSLASTIKEFARSWSKRTGIATTVDVDLPLGLRPGLAQALFRILQEALANVARHSGALQVTIDLRSVDETIALVISDDGQGFDARAFAPGIGLHSMRQRAEAEGGQFAFETRPGRGMQIRVTVPGP